MTVGIFDPADQLPLESGRIQGTDRSLERIPSISALERSDADFDFIIASGESALLTLVRKRVGVPMLPVGVDAGIPSIAKADVNAALTSFAAGGFEITTFPTMDVTVGEQTYRALMDAMAITAEPARISEYRTTIHPTGTIVDQVRADGLAVSGPAGTPGYGTAAGGPILGPDVQGLVVVPVGQFRTEQPHWVLNPPFEIEVVREEVPVSLVVDNRSVDAVPAHEPIRLEWGAPVECVVLEESVSPLTSQGADGTSTDEN